MARVSVAPLWIISSKNDSWQPMRLGDDPQEAALQVGDRGRGTSLSTLVMPGTAASGSTCGP